MVRTISSRTSRVVLAGVGLGALVTAVGTAVLADAPADAQATTSSAYGVSATGVESKAAQPSVSSAGETRTAAAGQVAGLGWNATSIKVTAAAGFAEAAVDAVTVAGRSLGGASGTCRDGAVSYQRLPGVDEARLRVRSGGDTAASVVEVLGAGGEVVQTITVAGVQCAKGVPPTTVPPTTRPSVTTQPTQQPTGTSSPTTTGQPTGTGRSTSTNKPAERPIQPAPVPEIKDGNHAVTG